MTFQFRSLDHLSSMCRCVVVACVVSACASTPGDPINMEGEWAINDELTSEIRLTLPEPKQPSNFLGGFGKSTSVSVGVPGVPGGVPLFGDDEEEKESARMHSYGRVAAIEIRQGPNLFGVDYGKGRGFLYTPNETTVEDVDDREITTKSGWKGDRYVVRKKADDGSKLSEEFELINDGQQLKWTIVDSPKGRAEVTDAAIYDRVKDKKE